MEKSKHGQFNQLVPNPFTESTMTIWVQITKKSYDV